jgi:hypothetical protein
MDDWTSFKHKQIMTLEQKRKSSRDSMRKLRLNPDYRTKERAYYREWYKRQKVKWAAEEAIPKS